MSAEKTPQQEIPCEDCHGTGSAGFIVEVNGVLAFGSWKCETCNGRGFVYLTLPPAPPPPEAA